MSSADDADLPPEDELSSVRREIRRLVEDPAFRSLALGFARRAAARYGLAQSEAEDLCQAALLKIFRYSETHRTLKIENPRSFIFKVVLNEARRLYHKETGKLSFVKRELLVSFDEIDAAAIPDSVEVVQHVESMLLQREVMQCLDEDQRELFRLWLEGFSSREIQVELHWRGIDISHVTVASRLKVIVKIIRDCLVGGTGRSPRA